MRAAARQFLALAENAFVEVLRAPFFALVLLLGLLLAALLPAFDYLSFLDKRRLVADSLLGLIWAAGGLTAGLGAAAVVGDDLRRRAAPLVWTRPPGRALWLVARWAGLGGALLLLWLVLGAAMLWGSRIAYHDYWPDHYAVGRLLTVIALAAVVASVANLRAGRSLPEVVALTLLLLVPAGLLLLSWTGYRGHGRQGWPLVDWALLQPLLLTLPALGLLAAIGVVAALALDTVPTLLTTVALLLLGLAVAGNSPWLSRLLVPAFDSLWLAAEASWAEAARAALAVVLQTAGLLACGAAALGQRELR